MQAGGGGLKGAPVTVSVGPHNPAQDRLLKQMKQLYESQTCERISLDGDQMLLIFGNGTQLTVNSVGGFSEVN